MTKHKSQVCSVFNMKIKEEEIAVFTELFISYYCLKWNVLLGKLAQSISTTLYPSDEKIQV